jgi:hypothetical protein
VRSNRPDFQYPANHRKVSLRKPKIPARNFFSFPAYPYPIGAKFQIPQLLQSLQTLNTLYAILNEIQISEFRERRDILDMLDVVETEIQAGQVRQVFEALDMGYLVIVEVQLDEGGTEIVGNMDAGDLVLPQAEFLQRDGISKIVSTQA